MVNEVVILMGKFLLKIKLVIGRWLSVEVDYSFGKYGESDDKKLAHRPLAKGQSGTES